MSLRINRLHSGGLIPNYHCPSQCAHCLYACGPRRPRDYITPEAAAESLAIIRSLGCAEVHIGGGEPFLNPDGLAGVLQAAGRVGVGISYVETNSAWFQDIDEATALLRGLRARGLRALLVSMSPFHNAHIPFERVHGVVQACQRAGVWALPWVEGFWDELNARDITRPHSLERLGRDYLADLPNRYWLHLGGRAAITYAGLLPNRPLKAILSDAPCGELADTSHFPVDLYGNFIPGLCSGLVIDQSRLGQPLDPDRHPVLSALYQGGVARLLEHAGGLIEFAPRPAYLNKCHLCLEIRARLFRSPARSADLGPPGFYQEFQALGHVDKAHPAT